MPLNNKTKHSFTIQIRVSFCHFLHDFIEQLHFNIPFSTHRSAIFPLLFPSLNYQENFGDLNMNAQ